MKTIEQREIDKIGFNHVNKINTVKKLDLSRQGSLKGLNILAKFVKKAFRIGEASHNKDSQDLK